MARASGGAGMGISAKLRPTEGDGDGSGALSRELQLAENWGGADAARANSAARGRVARGADTAAAADGEDWECSVGPLSEAQSLQIETGLAATDVQTSGVVGEDCFKFDN